MNWLLRFSMIPLAAAFTVTALNSCGKPDATQEEEAGSSDISPYPNFRGQDVTGEKNFANLINQYLEGRPARPPWIGYWWPYTANGIASGTGGRGSSPAGKYDAARGGRTNAQSWEIRNHGSQVPKVQGWWGHCNGWCVAAALFPEPRESAHVNGIEFTVADIKALLTEAGMEASADYYGDRVDFGEDYDTQKYWDTVPDQFFLVLTNYMGKLKQTVLIDRFTGDQVWNQPLAGYKFEYPKPADYIGADPNAPGVYRINLTAKIWWMSDEVAPDALSPPFTFQDPDLYVDNRELRMEIWLDGPVEFGPDGKITKSGNVIVTRKDDHFVGGTWANSGCCDVNAWPDYMWVPYSIIDPTEHSNPEVSIKWIEDHLLVPGGRDDTSATPSPVPTAPSPLPVPRPSGEPTGIPQPPYRPLPTYTPPPPNGPEPTFRPIPAPAPTTIPIPAPAPEPAPRPRPQPTGAPFPWPWS